MASYNYATIRAGLVTALEALHIQSTGYVLSSPMAPSIECFPGPIDYDQAYQRGHDNLTFIVRLTVTTAIDEASQTKLDGYLLPSGATSVKALIETDKTLGGVVKDLQVTECSGYQVAQRGESLLLSADWTVELVA